VETASLVQNNFYKTMSIAGIFLCLLFILALFLGDVSILSFEKLQDSVFLSIIKDYRLPGTLVGIFAAINFALAGIILQIITKNNLTTPNIIGINTGASLFAVVSLLLFRTNTIFSTNIFAFLGAVFACLIYVILATHDHKKNIINGLALDSIFVSLTAILLLIFPNETGSIALWLAGSLWGKTYSDLVFLMPSALIGILVCMVFRQKLNLIALDDEQAISLGVNIRRDKILFLFLSCFLSGTAVACTGPIGFISLFVPNIARMIWGDNLKMIIPFSIVLSAIVITFSDILSRTVVAPNTIPVGVVVSIVCSPYLIFLIKER